MIVKEEIKHIAQLARLGLSATEEAQYSRELSAVLDHIDELKQVDVAGVEPTAQVTGLVNNCREDIVLPWDEAEVQAALAQAEIENGQVKVKRILQ